MPSDAVGTALGSRGSSIATYLDAIRIETVKKDQRIRTLEARISTLCADRADANALNDENRELKAEVEQLKREAHTYKAQVESMNSELCGVVRELAATKHDMEQFLNAEPGVEQLHADFVKDGCSDDNNCGNDENGGDDTEGVRDKESDRGDEGIEERTNTKTGEWIPSQPASLAPTRSILQEVCTPSPLKRRKATTEEDEPTISPTSKLLAISENVSMPLISALEKSRPWNAVYAKSPTFSHSFIYASLPKETKKVINSLLAFKSKFRRELWEQLHRIRFPSGGALVAAASAARASPIGLPRSSRMSFRRN